MRLRWVGLLIFCLSGAPVAVAGEPAREPAPYIGQRLSDALRQLQRPGLQFLFSDELVSPALRVQALSGSSDPLQQARDLLAPHALTLRPAGDGIHAVVTDTTAAQRSARAAELPESTASLAEVLVAASRYRIGAPDAPLTLDALDITDNPGPGDDPLRAIARLPGVTSDGISARTYVRGGDADEVLLLLDGFPLRRAFHLPSYQNLFSVIDANLIQRINVYSGGFPARFGNRMAGVFDLQSRAIDAGPEHTLGIDFFNATGSLRGKIERLDAKFLASGRIGTLSPLLGAFAPSVGDPRYSDAYLKVERDLGDTLQWSGNLLWARDEVGVADRLSGERATLEDRSRYLWMQLTRQLAPQLTWTTWLGQSVLDSERDGAVSLPGVLQGAVCRPAHDDAVGSAINARPANRPHGSARGRHRVHARAGPLRLFGPGHVRCPGRAAVLAPDNAAA